MEEKKERPNGLMLKGLFMWLHAPNTSTLFNEKSSYRELSCLKSLNRPNDVLNLQGFES
ncbi:hypothetical protein HanPSC8_Chr01g0020361 [Helianthus annuus]|nr:hypothetical protein HanPSC8_Chr01g0020361 [Helianthus annuus]